MHSACRTASPHLPPPFPACRRFFAAHGRRLSFAPAVQQQAQQGHSQGWALRGAAGAPDARYQAAEQEVPEGHVHVQVRGCGGLWRTVGHRLRQVVWRSWAAELCSSGVPG